MNPQSPTTEHTAENWQPIKSAPTTGRQRIQLLVPGREPQLAYSNTWWTAGFSVECEPTHWRPVPEHTAFSKPCQFCGSLQHQAGNPGSACVAALQSRVEGLEKVCQSFVDWNTRWPKGQIFGGIHERVCNAELETAIHNATQALQKKG